MKNTSNESQRTSEDTPPPGPPGPRFNSVSNLSNTSHHPSSSCVRPEIDTTALVETTANRFDLLAIIKRLKVKCGCQINKLGLYFYDFSQQGATNHWNVRLSSSIVRRKKCYESAMIYTFTKFYNESSKLRLPPKYRLFNVETVRVEKVPDETDRWVGCKIAAPATNGCNELQRWDLDHID